MQDMDVVRNHKILAGLALALLAPAATNAASSDRTAWTDRATDHQALPAAPSMEPCADSQGARNECVRPHSSASQPGSPLTDLDNGVPSYVPALTLDIRGDSPQIRLRTGIIEVSPYLKSK